MNSFGEVLTAMVTPFDDDLKINLEITKKLASFLINNGSDGLVVLGTTGEVPVLSFSEKEEVLKAVVEEIGGKAPVVAGTGSYSTQDSIKMTEKAEEIGVDGIMLVTPYYNKPPQEGLYKHFKMIAKSTSLPVLLYNVPGRTSCNLEAETVLKLAEIENIIAIKEASGDLEQVSKLARILPDDFYIYSGDDNLTLPILSVGGEGIVSVAAHLVGSEIKKMVRAFKKNDISKAQMINNNLGELFQKMFITTNPIPVKSSLNMIGMEVGEVRPPLIGLTSEEKLILELLLKDYSLLNN